MKPEDLKSPFSWDERQILIKDRVWFVPDYFENDAFHFPGWADPNVFGNEAPVYVEYCSGNGTWIAAKALADTAINWVAVEKKFCRVRKVWSKIKNNQLDNLFAICGEGWNLTRRYLPNASVDRVFINFPDPWPKKRHTKHRIIQPHFLDEMIRILKADGTLTFVTDDPDYSDWTIDAFSTHPGFVSCYEAPYYMTEQPQYGTSYFEELWRGKGKTIRYHQFQKKACASL